MKSSNYHPLFSSCIRLLMICIFGVISITSDLYGQEKPPRPIKIRVHPTKPLAFGAFCQGSLGGTVIITAQGARSATGDIVLLSASFGNFSPATIQVQALKGTVVSIATGLTGTLSGPGGTLDLQVGTTFPTSPFTVTTDSPQWMDIQVGGTLIVGTPGHNPLGSYSGTFNVTFIQE